MAVISIEQTYAHFQELDGSPLESGYIYIGSAGLNPETNAATVFWDFALTIPASQPIRTVNGRPSRSGSPARIYIDGDYSITVREKGSNDSQPGSIVYSALNHEIAASQAVWVASGDDSTYIDSISCSVSGCNI